ncbi:MAG TPA: 3-dehydroquinate synthase [Lutibacter sp.]|nr:3-dehydroquinate synthase [Lutibacter sp.]
MSVQPTIFYQKEAFNQLGIYLSTQSVSKLFILVDENTKKHCLPLLTEKCEHPFSLIEIKSGEVHKNLTTSQYIWQELTDKGAERNSLVLNLGGGVITDMGGFCAATFKRGIGFINIPTTLLGMVDAAIGGKTGIDFNGLKNQIGLFSNPKMVLLIPEFLVTLPVRELLSGLAEVIKYGLIDDTSIWETIKGFNTRKPSVSFEIIQKSIQIKERIVQQDPKEKGVRKTLNFGHTLGHAIETHFLSKSKNEHLLHGEAVAIGMILAVHLSFQTQGLPLEIVHKISTVLKEIYASTIPSKITTDDYQPIFDLLKHDKKNDKGKANFILLSSIGEAVLDCQISENEILKAFTYYNLLF